VKILIAQVVFNVGIMVHMMELYEDMHIYMHKGRRKREIIPMKVTSYLTHLLMDN